ncbi:hypothetical protein M9458_029916, partial [Cirrhinus mrigala]
MHFWEERNRGQVWPGVTVLPRNQSSSLEGSGQSKTLLISSCSPSMHIAAASYLEVEGPEWKEVGNAALERSLPKD